MALCRETELLYSDSGQVLREGVCEIFGESQLDTKGMRITGERGMEWGGGLDINRLMHFEKVDSEVCQIIRCD